MKSDRGIRIAVCLALLASFSLAFWAFLLSSLIAHGGVHYGIFPDSLAPALRTACGLLTVLALGCMAFIVLKAFCSGATKPRHLVVLCVSWVLATFALHCWLLYGLAGMPSWASAKRDSEDQTMALNSSLTAYEGTPEDRARARAAMQMQMPGRGVTVPSIEQKLAVALRFEENQAGYLKMVAAMADNAERRTARRAWICWATTAITPVIVLALFAGRTGRLTTKPQPDAPPNGGPAEPSGSSGIGAGPPSVS
jgi:hypothetical protein